MEIFFAIISAVFAIAASIFGVKNRIRNSKPGTRKNIQADGGRVTSIVSDIERLRAEQERIQELDARDDENLRKCRDILERISKREPETEETK